MNEPNTTPGQCRIRRESDGRYVTGTLTRESHDWEWGDKPDAVLFFAGALPPLSDDWQIEEVPS